MSQETSREKKRRSPERQTPCTACPQRVPGFPPPGPAPPPERATQKGTNPRQPHLSPAWPGHPPCSILRVRGRGCASSLHRFHLERVTARGVPRFTWGNPRAGRTCPGDANPHPERPGSPRGGCEPRLSGIQRRRLREKKKNRLRIKQNRQSRLMGEELDSGLPSGSPLLPQPAAG